MTRRALTTLLLVVVSWLAGAGVAWAHAGGLTSASNEPVVLALDPTVPGLEVTVVEFGARLRMVNHTPEPVAVVPPPGSVVNALPTLAPGASALWADPRVAMAAARPRPPDGRLDWEIPLRVGAADAAVRGEQRWPPPPPVALWWLVTAVAVAVPAGPMVAARRLPGPAGRHLARLVLTAATLVVIAAHLVHIYGSALVPAEGAMVWVFLSAAGFAVLAWPIGLAGGYATMRGNPSGPLLCLVAGALIAVIISPADLFSFSDAVIPYAWGADLDRLLIALNVGGGLGVIAAATMLMRSTPARAEAGEGPDGEAR